MAEIPAFDDDAPESCFDLKLELELAAQDGNEARVIELLRLGADPGTQSEGAFYEALEARESRCAALIFASARQRGLEDQIDLSEALRSCCENEDWDTAKALVPFATEDECYYAAYGAQREGCASEELDFLFERAHGLERARWQKALLDGLTTRWNERPQGLYETLSRAINAPLWASAAAAPLDDLAQSWELQQRGEGFEHRPESRLRQARALGRPAETILVDELFFQHWGLEFLGQKKSVERERLADFEAEWKRCENAMPKLLPLIQDARSKPAAAEKFARLVERLSIERFAPFFLVWGDHDSFGPKDAERLMPIVDVCRIDQTNAGFLCANLDYGSFNARVACLVTVCRQRGVLDDQAARLIDARFSDIIERPELSSRLNSSFAGEILSAARFFKTQSERLAISDSSAPAPTRPGVRL